MMVA
jgi:hypothetical protein